MYLDDVFVGSPRMNYSNGACFIRVCPKCGRFVKADDGILINSLTEEILDLSNATCKKCGRVNMPLEGYFSEYD